MKTNKSELISWILLSSFAAVTIAMLFVPDKTNLCIIVVSIGALKMAIETIQSRNKKLELVE